jgi:glycosyltransferase involved in cell wall biosynthesis
MTSFGPARALFAGRADYVHSLWFRCALPAMQLGADWCGYLGAPGKLEFSTGVVRRPISVAAMAQYDVVVLQHAEGSFVPLIEELQAAGTTVLYEIDEDPQGMLEHRFEFFRLRYDAPRVAGMEAAMKACDGVLVPTAHLARRVAKVNPRVWVCRNGLDFGRYQLSRMPQPGAVTVGWTGFVGHDEAMMPWLAVVAAIMRRHPHVRFHSVGAPFADVLKPEFGERVLALPWNDLMSFPASAVDFDIALAPSGPTPFLRAKSDLRWLEASALGIPTVADPAVFDEIEHGMTGFHARDLDTLERVLTRLVLDAGLRARVGAAAKEHVLAHRTIAAMAHNWTAALSEAADRVREAA